MIQGHKAITKEMILSVRSEEDLFRLYCPPFEKLDTAFCSELRHDSNPSCRITDLGSGLRYKDFGTAIPATDIWGYVQLKYNLDYTDALAKIAVDLQITNFSIPVEHSTVKSNQTTPSKTNNKSKPIILIKRREWLMRDKEFWYNRYFITRKLLEDYKVEPITRYWIIKDGEEISFETDRLAYCYNYYYHNNIFLRKIYQPLRHIKNYKWVSNIDTTIVQGIDVIPKTADILIIASSLKDTMCWNLLGYPAVAPNNEASWIPSTVWDKFEKRYKYKVIFFDNDKAGIENASKFSSLYNVPYKHIPLQYNTKNISDYIEQYKTLYSAKSLVHEVFNSQ